jgi:hypothetical protein
MKSVTYKHFTQAALVPFVQREDDLVTIRLL